ncbi:MAG: hypothetical protein JWP60_1272 [Ramlibacter sp.]|nr:hypothetical protein [Ramlibacter sp.]
MSQLATRDADLPVFDPPYPSAGRMEDAPSHEVDDGRGMLANRSFWSGGLLSLLVWTLIVFACTRG